MAIQAGDVVWQIKASTDPLKKGMQEGLQTVQFGAQKIADHARQIGIAFTAAGAGINAALTGSVYSWATAGNEIDKASKRMNMGAVATSEFKHALELSGASLNHFETAIKRMGRTLIDAERGSAEAEYAIEELGLSVEDFAGKSPDEQFMMFAEALYGVEDASKQSALAQMLFGRAGTQLLPLINQGTEAIMEQRQEAHELGRVFDEEAAEKAAALVDDLDRLQKAIGALVFPIAEALAPTIMELAQKFTEVSISMRGWMEEHPGMTKAITIVVGAIGVLLSVLGPILMLMPGIVATMGLFSGSAVGAGGAIAGLSGALIAALPVVAMVGAALILLAPLIAGVAKEYRSWRDAVEQKRQSEERLAKQIDERIKQIEAMGIAVDKSALKEMDAQEQILYLNGLVRDSQDETLKKYLESYGDREKAHKQFAQAKNLLLNEELSVEEAAKLAMMDLDADVVKNLMAANEEQTRSMLEFLGVRESIAQESVEIDRAAADKNIQAQKETVVALEGTNQELQHLTDEYGQSVHQSTSNVSASMQKMAAVGENNVERFTGASSEYLSQFDSAATQYLGSAGNAFEQLEIASEQVPSTMARSMEATVRAVSSAVDQIEREVMRAIRALQQLNANKRHSPSINDQVRSGLATMKQIFSKEMAELTEITGGPHANLSAVALPVPRTIAATATERNMTTNNSAQVTIDLRGSVMKKDADINTLLDRLSDMMTARFSAAGLQYG